MNRTLYLVIIATLIAVTAFAEFEFEIDGWKFEKENTNFGLDIVGGAGYAIPLNLNDKPENRDLAENYDPIAPSIIVRAGLGAFQNVKDISINGTFAFEYSFSQFENDSVDLTFNSFGFYKMISAHPVKNLSVRRGSSGGLFILSSDPEFEATNTFADYSSDTDARIGKPHVFDTRELGLGLSLGKTPIVELSADARMTTYYPRYIVWPELVRTGTYGIIESGFNELSKRTDVWALAIIGPAVVTTLEVFNLNFYPEKVGETHQHIFTPSLTLTVHF